MSPNGDVPAPAVTAPVVGGALVCGIDVGGTKLLAVAFAADDPTGWRLERRVPTPRSTDALVSAAAAVVEELQVEATAAGVGDLSAVGLGIAGLVDRSGVVRVGPNIPGIVDCPVGLRLADLLGVPVAVENDASAAAWGEHVAGAGRAVDELLVVTLGTGIGTGMVSGGRLVTGAHGFAGEAGHMVVDPNGPPCPCGQRGCWERFASGSGLGRLARDAAEAGDLRRVVEQAGGDPEAVRGEHVTAAAEAGDPQALVVLDTFAGWVALGLANLTNVLDPEAIVIGGGLVRSGDTLLEPVRRWYERRLYATDRRPPPRLLAASLGEQAGAIGAALLAAAARV